MQTLWRWFFRFVIAIGILFAIFSVLLVVGMNRPLVTQSDGFTSATDEAVTDTLSQTLPTSAANVRHCRASLGMGGRLLIYRFSAPVTDLHSHAKAEFAAHWDKPQFKTTPNVPSPITDHDIALYESGFSVQADWMLPHRGEIGTLYESADGQFSHRPTIFVDDTNGVLYFQMTD